VITVPSAARFWDQIDAVVVQGQCFLRACHRVVLRASSAAKIQLPFVFAEIRRRMDAAVPQGERLVRTFCQPFSTSSPRKTVLTFVAAGIVALAVIFVLLEISVRRELAKEAADAMAGAIPIPPTNEIMAKEAADAVAGAIPIPSATPNQIEPEDLLLKGPTHTETVDPIGALATTQLSDHAQTLGQTSQKLVPMPRRRMKPR
jgi:hypothetical protein